VREFLITHEGLQLVDVYLGPDGILTGSARAQQMLLEQTGEVLRTNAYNIKDREIIRKRKVLESKIASLHTEFESVEEELNKVYQEELLKKQILEKSREEMTKLRKGEHTETPKTSGKDNGKKNR
jgi:circadian clock protein KaiC